jgi:hypothetical protein
MGKNKKKGGQALPPPDGEADSGGAEEGGTDELKEGAGAAEPPRGDDGAFDAAPPPDGSDAELTAEQRAMEGQKTQVWDAEEGGTDELQEGAKAAEPPRRDDGAFDAAPLLDGSDAELTAEEKEMVWQKTQV